MAGSLPRSQDASIPKGPSVRCATGSRHHRSRGPGSTHDRICPLTVSPDLGIPDTMLLADNARFHLTAIAQRCAITIVYDRRLPQPRQQTMTPRLVLEVYG